MPRNRWILILALSALAPVWAAGQEIIPDHSRVPGVVIDYSPARSQQYIGSPSLAVLPDGTYIASHDIFGPGSTYDRTRVFGSKDRGKSWTHLTDIEGQWWSSLFLHRGALYIMGVDRQNGRAVIRRSQDRGRTWTDPMDKRTGLLLDDARFHCAPVPVLVHKGRIWRAMEDTMGPGSWGSYFRSFMMSAQVDADLLNADSWTSTNRLGGEAAWLNGKFGGWLEGNAVATRSGEVLNLLRVEYPTGGGMAATVHISKDGKAARFDPGRDLFEFPGGSTKFTIRYDPKSRRYWSLSNFIPEGSRTARPGSIRNTLALIFSADLRRWIVAGILLQHEDPVKTGFQYVDWQFEGDDIVAVTRTAFDDGIGGAHNYHDANYLTFHRVRNFRKSQSLAPR